MTDDLDERFMLACATAASAGWMSLAMSYTSMMGRCYADMLSLEASKREGERLHRAMMAEMEIYRARFSAPGAPKCP